MTPRYLVAVAYGVHRPEAAMRIARLTGLECVFEHPRILAFANASCRRHPLRDQGILLGTLFWRHGPAQPIDTIADKDVDPILATPQTRLISTYWGGYVGAIDMGSCVRLLRDPSATLPCYHVEVPGMTLLSSEVGLLFDAGCSRAAIDWLALGRHHFTAGLPSPDTALAGVKELMPGCVVDLEGAGARDQQMCWSPWEHVERDDGGHPGQIEETLHRLVNHCVAAWTFAHDRLLASVSGGVDSSIVAAGLVRSRRDVRCLTMYTDDPAGDERAYARVLCDHLGLELHARPYLLDHVDLDRPLSAHLPRPIGRAIGQAFEQAHLDLARDTRTQAFVSGIGGDNVFGYSQSGAAIADRWIREGLPAALATLRDVCRQTGCGPFAAIRAAVRNRRKGRYVWRSIPDFLHPDLCASFTAADLRHPWLEAPPGALPGKAAHIASLLRLHQLLEPGRKAFAPVLYPLVSQPLVEMCLAIPSWQWRAGGMDRAVARRAFAGDLPEMTLQRRIKGGPDGFSTAILRRHRAAIRERLLEGELARHAIVDREAIDRRLAGTAPLPPGEQSTLLDLLDTEAWASAWMRRLS